jgi:hypothetical protein
MLVSNKTLARCAYPVPYRQTNHRELNSKPEQNHHNTQRSRKVVSYLHCPISQHTMIEAGAMPALADEINKAQTYIDDERR